MDKSIWREGSPTVMEDEDEAALIREALANVVIARAQKAERTFTPSDDGVDAQLAHLDLRLASAQSPAELRAALLAISKEGKYSDEELEL